jgi:hypothetical protein
LIFEINSLQDVIPAAKFVQGLSGGEEVPENLVLSGVLSGYFGHFMAG